jgi:hypothetical protein
VTGAERNCTQRHKINQDNFFEESSLTALIRKLIPRNPGKARTMFGLSIFPSTKLLREKKIPAKTQPDIELE